MDSGISTIGALLGYAKKATSTPTAFTLLNRINSIGGISISSEQIDSSALEDLITRNIKGRGDTGGTFNVTVNVVDDTVTEWEKVITDAADSWVYFEIYIPGLAKAFAVKAFPPEKLPMPEVGQNSLLTMEIPLVIEEYVGLITAVKPTATAQK